ncbi:MAG: PAS domain S-box protein, partial [Bacteroidales bacterium]|nr:PAS domain S-box protein [Bacteroidales bacterium]
MPSSKTNQLRQKVEKLLQERGRVENFRKYAHKLERLIEELNVYQIEMDLQNEELRKSEENHHIEKEKYNDLFEFSPESLITLDKNLRITNSNLATVDLLELERSRLLSQPFSSFVHPDDQDDFYRLLKSLVEKKGDASLEVDLLNHHNLRVHVRISARHLNDLHYADRIMLVITDISQLKNTQLDLKRKNERIQKQNRRLDKQNHEFQAINEELRQTNEELEDLYVKLQKSEKRYRLLFEESTDPSLMLQGDQFVEANQAALDFLGYKDYEEIVGKKPWEVSPPKQADGEDSQKKAKAYIRDAIKKGYQRFEWLHTDKNNKERWIDVSLTYLPTAPDQSIYTIWRDITEAKRSEEIIQEKNEEIATQNEELQTQNEELAERNELILKTNEQLKIERNRAQHYLDVAGVMFVAINQEGIVTLANKKAAEILGYSEDEIVGKNWFDSFLLKDNISKIKDVFNDIMKGKLEQLEYVENFVVSRSGEIRMIAWHNSLLQGENGEITGTLSSGEDITEKHMAEKELKKIEWLLNPKSKKKEPHIPAYGDLRKLNTQRTILEAVGEKMLNE